MELVYIPDACEDPKQRGGKMIALYRTGRRKGIRLAFPLPPMGLEISSSLQSSWQSFPITSTYTYLLYYRTILHLSHVSKYLTTWPYITSPTFTPPRAPARCFPERLQQGQPPAQPGGICCLPPYPFLISSYHKHPPISSQDISLTAISSQLCRLRCRRKQSHPLQQQQHP
jgi:hypothetical protein